MKIAVLIPVFALLVNTFAVTYVLAQRKRSPVNRAFVIFAVSILFWLLLDIVAYLPMRESSLLVLMKIRSLFWLAAVFLFLNFTYALLDRKRDWIWYGFAVACFCAQAASLSTDWIVHGTRTFYWGSDTTLGPLGGAAMVGLVLLPGLHALRLIFRAMVFATNEQLKNQLKTLLIGAALGFGCGFTTDYLLPEVVGFHDIVQLASFGTVILSLYTFVAIVQHQFLTVSLEEVAEKLFANVNDAVILLDNVGVVVKANPAATEFFGANIVPGTVLRNVLPFYSPEKNMIDVEKSMMPVGKSRLFSVSQSRVESTGRDVGRLFVARDVTRRKEAEDALRFLAEFERIIIQISARFINLPVDHSDIAVNEALDEIGRFARVDRSYVFLLTQNGSRVSNTHEWVTKGMKPSKHRLQDIPISGLSWIVDRLARGEEVVIPAVEQLPVEAESEKTLLLAHSVKSVVLVPITNSKGLMGFIGFDAIRSHRNWPSAEIGLLKIVGDVIASAIQRRNSEMELTGYREKLEILVEERTAELSEKNKQLANEVSVRKKAQVEAGIALENLGHVNRELNNFAYIVSHDLKAPLRGIASLAEWLSVDYKDKLDDQAREYLKLMGSRVSRMHALIDGVLHYSRIGRINEAKTHVHVRRVVREVCDLVTPPPRVRIECSTPFPPIFAQATLVIQIFQNLISNAVKFTKDGPGLIQVGCEEIDGESRFFVRDDGPGVKPEDRERIFEIFCKLGPDDAYESTGIGLTIVKKIVESYRGRIWVESTKGRGAVFYFTLPDAIDKEQFSEEIGEKTRISSEKPGNIKKCGITPDFETA